MKDLRIVYGDQVLYDGPVGKLTWAENDSGIVELRAEPPGPNWLERLQGAAANREILPTNTAGQ